MQQCFIKFCSKVSSETRPKPIVYVLSPIGSSVKEWYAHDESESDNFCEAALMQTIRTAGSIKY